MIGKNELDCIRPTNPATTASSVVVAAPSLSRHLGVAVRRLAGGIALKGADEAAQAALNRSQCGDAMMALFIALELQAASPTNYWRTREWLEAYPP